MIPAKAFYLIRHGETEANAAKITAGGGYDSPLTDIGRKQAQMVADVIEQLEVKPTRVIHSPMTRARDTANYINDKLGLDSQEVDTLREHMVGEWEGKPWEEVMPHVRANIRPPGGENKDDFAARVKNTLTDILHAHDDPVMIVAHGGTFYSILHLYEQAYDSGIENCHLHYFEPAPDVGDFPWRIWQFDIEEDNFIKRSAPFCGAGIPAKAV